MPRTLHDPGELLAQLEAARNRFEPGAASDIIKLLSQLGKVELDDPHQLLNLHEALLFLRAFPQSASLVPYVEHLLDTFHQRIERLRAGHADMSVFDDFDTSGIAGTTMQDVLSFDVSQWLVRRIPRNVEIAWDDYWDDYQGERNRGNTWPRFIPLLEEDADVEADTPWRRWLDVARGRQNALPWLLKCFAQLPLPARQQAELYDSLRLPIRWRLENLKFSRTRNWRRPRRFFFHDAPLMQRREVSLARELSEAAPKIEKLSAAAGEAVINSLREFEAVRYRDLYGATLGDPRTVVRADLGRGAVIHLWGLPANRRLPLRAYVAGYTLKNGVAINYFEAIGLCEWLEVGFNTFYTYRHGETAWIYAQTLRCLRAATGVQCFSIYPYQIGQDNDEALDSGAFWFYRKLGFRPGRADLQKLCEREEQKIAADVKYRTPRRTLKRLAEAHMFYEMYEPNIPGRKGRENSSGPWDTFSVRKLGLLINRRMARNFDGDGGRIRQASVKKVSRTLGVNLSRWNPIEQQAFENWALVLSLFPGLQRWSVQEKRDLVKIIRAKSALDEMSYLRLTQRHPLLRQELLRLGSQ
jgi:hypothetical protein